jgi:hypothetical protein
METFRASRRLTRQKKTILLAIYSLTVFILVASAAEVTLRLKGLQPWHAPKINVKVAPGGRFSQPHPTLGYTSIPGTFTTTYDTGRSSNETHLPNTLRITHPIGSYSSARRKEEIWVFGCSFTYGWSLNDEETYPWLLQEQFREYEVVNFGVAGYSTLQSLVQFREALPAKTPTVVVLAYADFHDERNTLLRKWRKLVVPWNKRDPIMQPYARLDGQGKLRYFFGDIEYQEFPAMRYSALSHFLEVKYNDFEDQFVHSHAVSEALILEMARIAKEHQVKFIVAGIFGPKMTEMLDFTQKHGIPSVDISVELVGANLITESQHPSANANREYANKLGDFLRQEFLKPNRP